MCGICGKLLFDPGASVSPGLLRTMADTLRHRGPDDEGFYAAGPVGLGFRRLSIIDLTTGHQPVPNEDDTVWLVFNGEIYNYRELRETLVAQGHQFRTSTDTEVIVHLYEELGENCVDQLRGMFGFALWDARRKKLFLARDRVGIKPLYYRISDSGIHFASEIRAILADPAVRPEVAPALIDRLLTFDYLPGPETLFKDIRKLEPGHCLTVQGGRVNIRPYWDLRVTPSRLSPADATAHLAKLLEETVRQHLISDVPLGLLLSGGFDSTALLSLATESAGHPLRTFTVGFSDPAVEDERPWARLAARHFGAEHHEMTISPREFGDFLPHYVRHMEEPVCEPPAVALYYVSKLAAQSVKVLLSGEGGDEAFAGYPNYRNLLWLERLKSFAGPLGKPLSRGLAGLSGPLRSPRLGHYAALLDTPFEDYYYSRTSSPDRVLRQRREELYTDGFARAADTAFSLEPVRGLLRRAPAGDRVNRMLYVDSKTWLTDDLLLKADKITMANAVELRVPFLDHKVLEFAASLPGHYKVRGLTTKHIAKQALRHRIPAAILTRKKAGFPVPYAKWLRTGLKDWLHDLLLDARTLGRGYFRRPGLERMLAANAASGAFPKELFTLAVLELWHREFLDGQASRSARAEVSPGLLRAR